jgi:hypothetical protein
VQSPFSALSQFEQEFYGTSEGFKPLKEELEGLPWVYIGDHFLSPKALAFDSPTTHLPLFSACET